MTILDLYLRAASEAELADAIPWARDDEEWIISGDDWALDLIGTIGADVGYHANLRTTSEAIAASVPEAVRIAAPSTPMRVWA